MTTQGAEQATSTPASPDEVTPAQQKNSAIRDYVTMGIFIALYILLFMISGMTMSIAPIIMVLLPVIFGVFGGVIFTALLAKVQRPGAFLITGAILGLSLLTMAPGGSMCYMTILGGVLAELVYGALGRKSFRSIVIAYTSFIVCYAIGEYIPFVWMKEAYLSLYADQATLEVARAGTELLNPGTMALLTILGAVAALIGCLWGRALTRKQFRRAGIL